jgi:hypothetical protein
MGELFYFFGVIAYFIAFIVLGDAETAFQENTGFVIILIGSVFIVGAVIVGTINSNFRKLNESVRSLAPVKKPPE